jgi:maltooligosyltrehalose trehalohydrolase
VLGPEAFLLRWFDPAQKGDDRLILVNLGTELRLPVTSEPLLAPPEKRRWQILWSSADPCYGGAGTAEPEAEEFNWRLAAHSAIVMMPAPSAVDEYREPPGSA